jgi:hypothetical protein
MDQMAKTYESMTADKRYRNEDRWRCALELIMHAEIKQEGPCKAVAKILGAHVMKQGSDALEATDKLSRVECEVDIRSVRGRVSE